MLTAESSEALLPWLDPDRERAGERCRRLRERLIGLFSWRGCARAEDLADETIQRVALRLGEGAEPPAECAEGFVYGLVQRVFREVLGEAGRQDAEAAGEELAAGEHGSCAQNVRARCFERCLAVLPVADRRLLMRYHDLQQGGQARKILGDELGISASTLRIRVHRIRRKLFESVARCLEDLTPDGAGGP